MRSLAVAVVVLGLGVSASGQDKETMKKEVISADRARQAAFTEGDGDAWAKHILDGCRWIDLSTGEALQDKAERAANLSPSEPSKMSDEKFHFGGGQGNTVTQTGLYTGNGTVRFARVWQKREGQRMMLALYYVPPE